MKVVLTKDVKKLGFSGDIVEVSPGYARNFLFPGGFAVLATATSMGRAQYNQATRVKSREEVHAKAGDIEKVLRDLTLVFTEKVSAEHHLYGSVTETDIVKALRTQAMIELNKDQVQMEHHLKELGNFEVSVMLPNGTAVPLKVEVKAEGSKEEKAPRKKAKAAKEKK